jgi:hypothetical protein
MRPAIPPDEDRCIFRFSESGLRCKAWRSKKSDFTDFCGSHQQYGQPGTGIEGTPTERRAHVKRAQGRVAARLESGELVPIRGAVAVIDVLEERLTVQVELARELDGIVAKLMELDALRYEGKTGEQLRGELAAWLSINQMVTKLGADYLKIGLDERKVRIAEAQARILVAVIQAVMVRLDLTSEQRKIAAVAIPEELQRVAIEAGSSS